LPATRLVMRPVLTTLKSPWTFLRLRWSNFATFLTSLYSRGSAKTKLAASTIERRGKNTPRSAGCRGSTFSILQLLATGRMYPPPCSAFTMCWIGEAL
jgi:hypothetical protein